MPANKFFLTHGISSATTQLHLIFPNKILIPKNDSKIQKAVAKEEKRNVGVRLSKELKRQASHAV